MAVLIRFLALFISMASKNVPRNFLYSYRRCPYAMRARMALISAQIQCDVQDIDFRDKPERLLSVSPKGTVPVLITVEGQVIDESLDIVYWALKQNDEEGLLSCEGAKTLIDENDGTFKQALDRYKYPERFPDEDCSNAWEQGVLFLEKLDNILSQHNQLLADTVTVADICIFPFIRQFANVDRTFFGALPLPHLHKWLSGHLESALFKQVIVKHPESAYSLL
jgi:glutathione S-transferase